MRWIIVPILLLNFNTVFSQTNQHCEKLYYIPDKLPEYEGGQPALMIFYAQKILPIFIKDTSGSTLDLCASLTINSKGNVIDVQFITWEISEKTEKALKEIFLTMKNWKPAQVNGQNVCCYYSLPINCNIQLNPIRRSLPDSRQKDLLHY